VLLQALVASALAAGAAARDCDTYSFCEDPGMTIAEGNFEYGVSAYGHTCLADTKNAQSFRYKAAAGMCCQGVFEQNGGMKTPEDYLESEAHLPPGASSCTACY